MTKGRNDFPFLYKTGIECPDCGLFIPSGRTFIMIDGVKYCHGCGDFRRLPEKIADDEQRVKELWSTFKIALNVYRNDLILLALGTVQRKLRIGRKSG